MAGVALVAATLAYTVYATDAQQRQAKHASGAAQEAAAAEIAERNRLTAEHTAAVTAEAERQRALAISNQEAQNLRVNLLAAETASNEKAIAHNIAERSAEEALIVQQESAREAGRVKDLEAQTRGRQMAALASSGVDTAEGGTAKTLLLDTETRTNKDVSALREAAGSKMNLLARQGAFALEQGETSSKNILESAEHATKTNIENVKSAADTLVANAKIGGANDTAMANLQNLMTAASANQFSQQMDRLRSEANARLWGSLLSTGGGLVPAKTTTTSMI